MMGSATMKFLFIHNNYPAQFVHLATELSRQGHEVFFLSAFKRHDVKIEGVHHIIVSLPSLKKSLSESHKVVQSHLRTGEVFGNAMLQLARQGFQPDVVYAHPGWGGSIYVPDIFPDAAYVIFCEWFYTKGEHYHFFERKSQSPIHFAPSRHRNLYQLEALRSCHCAICPTFWQQSQYPREYLSKFHVIHDGIDMDFFSPQPDKEGQEDDIVQGINLSDFPEIVTYATRGLEPYRGFPQFFRSLPEVLAKRPDCHIVIMANDEVRYSSPRSDKKSWGEIMRKEVNVDQSRVHFIRFGPYEEYRKVLRNSTVHIYLTVPFVLSWSLLEAMSCGCLVVASSTSPVKEVIRHGQNGFLVPFWKSPELAKTITHLLEQPQNYNEVRANARQTIHEHYSLEELLPVHIQLLQETAEKRKIDLRLRT